MSLSGLRGGTVLYSFVPKVITVHIKMIKSTHMEKYVSKPIVVVANYEIIKQFLLS